MRLDSAFYNNIIEMFDLYIDKVFGTDIKKTETVYEYSPNHYKIVSVK